MHLSELGRYKVNEMRQRNILKWAASMFLSGCLFSLSILGAQSNTAAPTTSARQTDSTNSDRAHDDTYSIGADDILAINVWKEPDLTRSVPVRSDGKISLPLIGELQAAGVTPKQLEQDISKKLTSYVAEPEVTVIVQEIRSRKFNILGQVAKPGSFPITRTTTVIDAIALAGGFRDFAKQKSIYILRQKPDGTQQKLPFNYKEVVKGKNVEQNITLEPRDTVVVP
jgi:polysaccharide export outer membrane protein